MFPPNVCQSEASRLIYFMNSSLVHITYTTELLRFSSMQEIILVPNLIIRVIVLVVDICISAKAERSRLLLLFRSVLFSFFFFYYYCRLCYCF